MNLKRWLPFTLFFVFIISIVACADGGKLRWFFDGVNNVPFGDKIGHFCLIGTLALLFNRALSWRALGLGRVGLQLGGLVVLILITGEEISQIWIPWRTFDLGDLAANYMGIFVADLVARKQRDSSSAQALS